MNYMSGEARILKSIATNESQTIEAVIDHTSYQYILRTKYLLGDNNPYR